MTTTRRSRVQFTAPDVATVEAVLCSPQSDWAHQCHAMSLALVRSGLLPEGARVARGGARQVGSQHSWAVLGDPYDPGVTVVDITLWSYDPTAPVIYVAQASDRPHTPHGMGSIWRWGRPPEPVSEVLELASDPGPAANDFLRLASPTGLDLKGWMTLANAPVEGWPAREILTAMAETPRLAACVPIDILGMVTDLNPKGLYF
jgi:hypothetical protein